MARRENIFANVKKGREQSSRSTKQSDTPIFRTPQNDGVCSSELETILD